MTNEEAYVGLFLMCLILFLIIDYRLTKVRNDKLVAGLTNQIQEMALNMVIIGQEREEKIDTLRGLAALKQTQVPSPTKPVIPQSMKWDPRSSARIKGPGVTKEDTGVTINAGMT